MLGVRFSKIAKISAIGELKLPAAPELNELATQQARRLDLHVHEQW
jgi:hypothetical protein